MVEYAGIIGINKNIDELIDRIGNEIIKIKEIDPININYNNFSMVAYDYSNETKCYIQSKDVDFFIDGYILPNDKTGLLKLYKKHGMSITKHLNGTFNIIIYDKKQNKVLLANDKYGLRQLFCYYNKNYVLFSTQIFPLLVDRNIDRELDLDSMSEFFEFGSQLGNKTLLKNIKILSGANTIRYENSQFIFNQYWNFHYERLYDTNKLLKKVNTVFDSVIDTNINNVVTPKNIGLLLSGGLDSRLVLGAVTKQVKTFTFGSDNCNEMKISKKVAKKTGVKNEQFILEPESFLKWGNLGIKLTGGKILFYHFFNLQIIDKMQNDSIDILLHGFGLGELLGGQELDKNLFNIKNKMDLETYTYNKMNYGFTDSMLCDLLHQKYYDTIKGKAQRSLHHELSNINEKSIPDIYEHLAFHTIIKEAMTTAAYRSRIIKDLTPLYDNKLMDVVLQIPAEYRYKHTFYINLFKHKFPALSRIKYANTGVALCYPFYIQYMFSMFIKYYRGGLSRILNVFKSITGISIENKKGNLDIAEWIRSEDSIRLFIEDILLNKNALYKEYVNQNYVKQIIDEHMNYKYDNNSRIYILLTLELFLKNMDNVSSLHEQEVIQNV